MGNTVSSSNATVLCYSMIKVMSVASGHISQNYTNVNFAHYIQKNVENVGLVYERSPSVSSDSSAGIWLSFDETRHLYCQ